MIVQLHLGDEVRRKLLDQAARQGRDLDAVITDMVELVVNASESSLDRVLASFRRDVLAREMTEDGLGEFFQSEARQAGDTSSRV